MKKLEDRQYQQETIEETVDAWDGGADSAMIESPTGSGKTIMGLCAAKQIAETLDGSTVIMWVALRRELLRQVERDNRLVGAPNLRPVSAFDPNYMSHVGDAQNVILVLDEAHHSASDTCVGLWAGTDPAYVIGLSATGFRSDNVKLCFERTIRRAGYARLIADDYLAKYDHYLIDNWQPKNVAKRYIADLDRWGKSAIFFFTQAECEACAGVLAENGVKFELITGSSNREDQLERFEAGEVSVVISMGILCEGWDFPELETVFVRDSSRGPSIQMSGRVLRKCAGIDKKVVQSVGTRWNFTRTAPAESTYRWDNTRWLAFRPDMRQVNAAVAEADRIMMGAGLTVDPIMDALMIKFSRSRGRSRRDYWKTLKDD